MRELAQFPTPAIAILIELLIGSSSAQNSTIPRAERLRWRGSKAGEHLGVSLGPGDGTRDGAEQFKSGRTDVGFNVLHDRVDGVTRQHALTQQCGVRLIVGLD